MESNRLRRHADQGHHHPGPRRQRQDRCSRHPPSTAGCRTAVRDRDPEPNRQRDPSRSFPAGDSMTSSLNYKLFVTEQIPQSGRGPLPDGTTRMWSPITSTLIMGQRDAVLVDPPLTTTQAAEVGDWILASGHQLRQIYITHGHGDHWFGAIPLLQRFSDVAVLATEGTSKLMA